MTIVYPLSQTILPSFLWLVVYGFFILMMYLPALPVDGASGLPRDLIFGMLPFFMWILMTPFGAPGMKLDVISINPAIIFLAGLLTTAVSFAMGQNANIKKARKDPIANKAASATSYSAIAFTFALFVIILSRFIDLYRR